MRLMQSTGFLGVGNFGFTPSAQLHLNSITDGSANGNLIRTDGLVTETLTWEMVSGAL
jgi:hypothetical protein